MKIYSWNMLYRNQELDRAFDFVSKSDFDIFCLQEVPEKFLVRLKELPFHLAYRIDMEKISTSEMTVMFSVILSRYAITNQGEIPLADYWYLLPLRARLFTYFMRPFHFFPVRNRGGIFVDVTINEIPMRIFNLHLALAHPARRLEEFERAMLEREAARPTIVCGDFNILEKPHITPLNWLLGGDMADTLHYSRERTHIERRFVEHELINTLRGKTTHRLSRSQLDHILVSRSFSIKNAAVLPDRIGSDHHPIHVEIA